MIEHTTPHPTAPTGIAMDWDKAAMLISSLVALGLSGYAALRKEKRTDTNEDAELQARQDKQAIAQWRAVVTDQRAEITKLKDRHEREIAELQTQVDELREAESECRTKHAVAEQELEFVRREQARMCEEMGELKAQLRDRRPIPPTDTHHPLSDGSN